MKTKNIIIIISVILLALTFIGCIGVDDDFREVKSLVIKSTNEKFYKDVTGAKLQPVKNTLKNIEKTRAFQKSARAFFVS